MSGHDSCRRKKDLKSQGKSSFGSRNALSNLLIPYHNLWDLMVRNSPDRNQCRFINLLSFSSRFILNAKCFWFKSVSGWTPTHVCQFIVSRCAIRLFFALRIIRDPFEFVRAESWSIIRVRQESIFPICWCWPCMSPPLQETNVTPEHMVLAPRSN